MSIISRVSSTQYGWGVSGRSNYPKISPLPTPQSVINIIPESLCIMFRRPLVKIWTEVGVRVVCDMLTHWLPWHSPTHWKETPSIEWVAPGCTRSPTGRGKYRLSNYIFLIPLLQKNRNPPLRGRDTYLCPMDWEPLNLIWSSYLGCWWN